MMDRVQRDEENNTKFRRTPTQQAELEGLLPRNTYVEDTMESRVYSPVRKEPLGLYAESLVPMTDSAIDRGTIYSNSEVFDSLEKLRAEIEALRSSVCSRVRDKEDRVYETIDTKQRGRKKPDNNPPSNRLGQSAKDNGFYRLRFLIDPSVGALRRCVWLFLFVCAIAATVYQIRDRVLIYTRYPSNVNIDVEYVDALKFPAVTICNENKYRLTDTVLSGFYNATSALGQKRRSNTTVMARDNTNKTSFKSFLLEVAHQKADLINTCVWNNEPCGPENFTEVFTDHGLCYKFNPVEHKRWITRAGPMAGLFLILNAEQYEYMTDSKSAVGIKFSVHDQRMTPWLNEHGINAAVGTHTSVGLKKIVHANLPSPYGTCDEDGHGMRYSRDHCLRTCDQRRVMRRCGCYPPINMTNNTEECTVQQYFGCVQHLKGHSDLRYYHCDCQANCRHVEYQPTLSHAATSVYAGESIVRQFAKKKQLAKRLRLARDKQQRVDKAMFEYDSGMLKNISKGLNKSYYKIDIFCNYMMDSYKGEYESRLSKLNITLNTLKKTIGENLENFNESTHINFFPSVNHFREIFRTVSQEALAARNSKLKTTSKLNETAWKLLSKIEPLIKPVKDYLDPSGFMLRGIKRGVEKFREDLVERSGHGQKYEQFREHQDFYNKTTLQILNSTRDLFQSLTHEYNTVTEVTTRPHRTESSVQRAINDFLQTLQKMGYLTVPLLDLHISNLGDKYKKDRAAIINLATDLAKIEQTFQTNISNINKYLSAIKSTLSDLRDVTRTLNGKLSAIEKQYQNEDIDKTDMATTFDSNAIRSSLEKLRSSFRHLTSRFDNLLRAGVAVRDVIYPVENGTKDVDFDLKWLDFPNLQKETGAIKDCLEGIVTNVTDYQNDLKEYLKGNKLDENFYVNNYLHLEVYFTELSQTNITQHQSYSFFDLTCDIGGTLALYMGICILTIFETLDFVVNHILCPSSSRDL